MPLCFYGQTTFHIVGLGDLTRNKNSKASHNKNEQTFLAKEE
jgi:hypothetical protein